MATYAHLWYYLAQFFLEWEVFQAKLVEKIKTRILCLITFFQKLCHLWNNAEKFGRARHATDDNIIWHMHFACWITKATDTHSEYVIIIAFLRQQWLHKRASVLCCTYIACLVVQQFYHHMPFTSEHCTCTQLHSYSLYWTHQHSGNRNKD
jgi:hypothetical protein